MDVSIIIPSFNTKELTSNCIRSIDEDNTSKLQKEVIIIDNASSDGTSETLEKLRFNNFKLTIIRNNENIGFAGACNRGIRRSSGKYILLLNSDTKVTGGAIDKLVMFAENTPHAGVIGARLLNEDGSTQPSCFRLPTLFRAIRQYWMNGGSILDKYYLRGELPSQVEAVVGAAFLITPESIKKVGLLDERYFMFFEDLDYCRRVKRKGLEVYYLPQARVVHYHGESGSEMADALNQWRRSVPSSIIYHGFIIHYILWFVTRSRQPITKYSWLKLWKKLLKKSG